MSTDSCCRSPKEHEGLPDDGSQGQEGLARLRRTRIQGVRWRRPRAEEGDGTSFPRVIKLKQGETAIFSWITYKSKAHRDSVNKKVMKDPRLAKMMDPKSMPFDVKRMVYGGFRVRVSE